MKFKILFLTEKNKHKSKKNKDKYRDCSKRD
jgi:hypothetical protein